MKLHDLRPPAGAHTPRTRVGRGIAAGKGKTAGRGTKGQKSRTGSHIPPWFEGGQTPIHIRIPKLRGFRNRGKIEYEVVNVGRIAGLVEAGVLEAQPGRSGRSSRPAPITVNQEILRAAGLVSTLSRPLKVLGHGELSVPLFVVADAFSRSAVAKIEAAGGSVQVLEVPTSAEPALTGEPAAEAGPKPGKTGAGPKPSAAEAGPKPGKPEPAAAEGSEAPESVSAEVAPSEASISESPAPAEPASDAEGAAEAPTPARRPRRSKKASSDEASDPESREAN